MKSKAGRKKIDKEVLDINVTVRFSREEIKNIEEIAKSLDIPKTRLIRNLTLSSLEEAKIFNKIGAFKGVKKLLDFKKRFLNPEKYKTLETV